MRTRRVSFHLCASDIRAIKGELIRMSIHALLIALLALGTLSENLGAQTSRGTISGIVMDAQRAAIPNTTVELRALSTNVTRSTLSNDSGLYRFDAVDPG